MTFGERLYQLRTQKNISQEKFAEIMDVSRQSISKWETDKAYLELQRLIFMCRYFDVSMDFLVLGNEKDVKTQEQIESEIFEKYKSKKMRFIWNTFTSNLSDSQKISFLILAIIIMLVMFGIVMVGVYSIGYIFGQNLYYWIH